MDTTQLSPEPNVLYYWDKFPGQGGRPVPMTDMFPVFATDNVTLPIRAPALCLNDSTCGQMSQFGNAVLLDECMAAKCLKEMDAMSREVTVDHVLAASGTETPDAAAQAMVTQFFNAAGALEECKIRNCPIEFFNARSFYCLRLFNNYLYDRKMYIPQCHCDENGEVALSHKAYLEILRNGTGTIELIRKAMQERSETSAGRLGICVPAWPVGEHCDSKGIDATIGTPTRPTHPNQLTSWNSLWMYKFEHLRPLADSEPVSVKLSPSLAELDQPINQQLLTTPANIYTLAHCSASTGLVVPSKLGGQLCSTSIECMFGLCVDGKCSEAMLGKQLKPARAAEIVLDSQRRLFDRLDRANGQRATMTVMEVLGGVVVVRVLKEVYVRWRAARSKKERE